MSAVGSRTKKVVTYGKKKTRIINIHSDFSPSKDKEKATPPATPKREPLRRKVETPLQQRDTDTPAKSRPVLQPRDNTPVKNKAVSKLRDNTPVKSNALQPRDTNTPVKATPLKSKTSPLKQHVVSRRAVYRTSPEPSHHVVRRQAKPVPRRLHALRGMDRVEVTIETRTPQPPKHLPPEPTVEDVAREVVDLSLSDDEDSPVLSNSRRGRKPRRIVQTPEPESPARETIPEIQRTPTPTPTPEVEAEDAGLTRLLRLCSIPTPTPFDDIFTHPSFSALVEGSEIRKQGEASYSEVFRVGDAVVKVIPLLPGPADGPDCSEAADVAREVEVTRRLASVPGGGFINFRGAFVVSGSYPSPLLSEWDAWEAEKGTESLRPVFPPTQTYALIVLDDGGHDLESTRFDAQSWVDMGCVFWQVCDALARAEAWTQFEHRDLHEGQILLSPTEVAGKQGKDVNYLGPAGYKATVIDFGLSRLVLDGSVRWAPIPDECYEGRGAQWDVYRRMRSVVESSTAGCGSFTAPTAPAPAASSSKDSTKVTRRARRPRRTTKVVQYALSSDDDDDSSSDFEADLSSTPPTSVDGSRSEHSPWTRFTPVTNVLWLQYLASYLLQHGRKPVGRRPTSGPKLAARARQDAACTMLADVASTLAQEGMFDSARDVRAWGEECGWIQ